MGDCGVSLSQTLLPVLRVCPGLPIQGGETFPFETLWQLPGRWEGIRATVNRFFAYAVVTQEQGSVLGEDIFLMGGGGAGNRFGTSHQMNAQSGIR